MEPRLKAVENERQNHI